MLDDNYFMRQALKEAEKAFDIDEVPIGAVIVSNNRIIARAHNLVETLNDTASCRGSGPEGNLMAFAENAFQHCGDLFPRIWKHPDHLTSG